MTFVVQIKPFKPRLPAGPLGPVAPVGPLGPAGPSGPLGPGRPGAPTGPCGPIWPKAAAKRPTRREPVFCTVSRYDPAGVPMGMVAVMFVLFALTIERLVVPKTTFGVAAPKPCPVIAI